MLPFDSEWGLEKWTAKGFLRRRFGREEGVEISELEMEVGGCMMDSSLILQAY